MKKIISLLFVLIFVFSFASYAEENINVIVDGKTLVFDQYPIIDNGRTLVPMRKIFEELGAEVQWDDETKTAISVLEGRTVQIQIDNTDMCIDHEIKVLDVPAKLVNGRTLVPARAVAEAYDCDVEWDGETRTVIIKTEGYIQREATFKTYTSETYGYTIRYSDKYTLADTEAIGIKECDFAVVNAQNNCSLNVATTENTNGILTNTTPNLKETTESALGVTLENYEVVTLNGIPSVYYTFQKDGYGFMQVLYFTEYKVYTVTLTVADGADFETVSDMAFTLISLSA